MKNKSGITTDKNTSAIPSQLGSSIKKGKNPDESPMLLSEGSVYIDGIKVLQKQERVGYFFTLIISLVLVFLLFLVLRLV